MLVNISITSVVWSSHFQTARFTSVSHSREYGHDYVDMDSPSAGSRRKRLTGPFNEFLSRPHEHIARGDIFTFFIEPSSGR